jgi:ribosomal protein S18 acetylase RimI-like enzyme
MKTRPAIASDAESIATVHVRSWQAAYAHLLDADFLSSLSVEQRARRWADILRAAESSTVVAEHAGKVEAFISFAQCRDEGAPATRAEIWALYATPSAWGTGLGRTLLAHALASLQERGFRETSLWVLSGNARGVRFYGKAGFKAVPGSQKIITLGGAQLEETQMLLLHAA